MDAIAKPRPNAPASAQQGSRDTRQYLTFVVNDEMLAVDILNVKEIIQYGSLTPIPMMPAFIRGVINLRGAVVPVIDLAARLGARPTVVGKRTCIVILEIHDGEVHQDIGLVVDAVSEVLDIPPSEIEPAPSFGARIRTDFIEGMGKIAGSFVILLAIDKVLSIDEIARLCATTATETASAA